MKDKALTPLERPLRPCRMGTLARPFLKAENQDGQECPSYGSIGGVLEEYSQRNSRTS